MSARRRRGPGSLGARFIDHWRTLAVEAQAPLIVAVSGGVDSLTLLHLLRFDVAPPGGLHVAHFDHAWREGSEGEARWVAGVARAWGLECSSARAVRAPADEEEARGMRYAFLEEVRARLGARWVLTAHHADDQAETV
ncbi:MAG: tRNA lysidine(34) synthetase TilS, partial [Gemmatimonadetes bacterium]|nr:tRNA lysidine(34) synthetase TilS [Gemmatimonadota bacterium]